MVIVQSKSKRKQTGFKYRAHRKKRLYETGNEPANTRIGPKQVKYNRTKGGSRKPKSYRQEYVNVSDGKTIKKVKISKVVENPANRHFVRRNILTKGAVVETDIGNARITSRPGQESCVNAVLVK